MDRTSMNTRSLEDCPKNWVFEVEKSSDYKNWVIQVEESSNCSKNWAIQVEKSLTDEPPRGSGQVYQRVPKSLRNKNTEAFYTPQVISFGPYHFQMKKSIFDDEVEVLKSQVARKFNGLLPDGLLAVVENFSHEQKQTHIKKIYAKGFPFLSEEKRVLALMMTRDACFLMEILNMFSEKEKEEEKKESDENEEIKEEKKEACFLMEIFNMFSKKEKEEEEEEGDENGEVKGRSPEREKQIPLLSIYHPLLNDIVKDMFKMENQLPLWVLYQIVEPLDMSEDDCFDCFESALKNLSPVKVVKKDGNRSKYNHEYHILHLLHEYIVDKHAHAPRRLRRSQAIQKPHPPSFPVPNFRSVLSVLSWVIEYVMFLFFLTPLLVIWLTWSIMEIYVSDKAEEGKNHVPTLEELRRIGVRFRTLEGRGISQIKFEQSTRTLYLPKFKVDDRSEVILRNLMAMEIYLGDVEKPITRYAILMNDLVNTSEDIAILRRHNIITSKLGSDDDVARLWNSVVVATEMPKYEPIDRTAANINAYRRKRWKVLWAQFKMIHCSKPWLVVSLIGGTSLLLLSIVQVACLFRSCQIK